MEVAALHQFKYWSTGKFSAIAAVIPAKAGIQKNQDRMGRMPADMTKKYFGLELFKPIRRRRTINLQSSIFTIQSLNVLRLSDKMAGRLRSALNYKCAINYVR